MNNEKETVVVPAAEAPKPEPAPAKKIDIRMSTRTAVIIAVVIVVLAGLYYYKGLFIAATVNGQPISRFAVIGALEKQSGQTALDNLIDEKLIQDEAKKEKVTVSDSDVNAQIATLTTQASEQGGTLDDELAAEGMTRADLTQEVKIQLLAQKMLASQTVVSDADVEQYITDNKVDVSGADASSTKAQIKSQLQDQKFQTAAGTWLQNLRAQAHINYYVNYPSVAPQAAPQAE